MKILILAGGGGTRLFPLSTQNRPKQFLPLADNEPLIISTIKRFLGICKPSDIVILTGEKFKEETLKVLSKHNLLAVHVVLEPCAKNTAPAIVLGASYCRDVLKIDKSEPMFVVPSDQVIRPLDIYLKSIESALQGAKNKHIAVLGIKPTRPDTGYGYIEIDKNRKSSDKFSISKISAFKEKPDEATAKKFLKLGHYLWNAGMFAFSLEGLEQELAKHSSELSDFLKLNYSDALKQFSNQASISIDYALAEKSSNMYVAECPVEWSDIGSFDAYYDFCSKDSNGNVLIGSVVAIECKNCLIISDDTNLKILGQTNKIIVSSAGNTIVLDRNNSQEVKRFIST